MASIKDVALRAGVSPATVSNVLNQTKAVSAEKRERVLEAVRELNYIPNASARDLKRKTSRTIGVILSDIKSQFHTNLFNTFSSFIQQKGYGIQVAFTDNVISTEQQMINRMLSQGVDGIILTTCQSEEESDFWKGAASYQIPILFVERRIPNVTVNYTGFNNYKTLYEVTSQLLEKGYREIALFCGSLQYSSEAESVRGFREAFAENGLTAADDTVTPVDMIKESAMESCMELLHSGRPQVIICTSHEIAEGITFAVKYNGLKPFQDLLIIEIGEEGWDHSFTSADTLIVSRSASRLAELSAERMFNLIESPAFSDPVYIEMEEDQFAADAISRAPASQPAAKYGGSRQKHLRIMMIQDASEYALTLMLPHFEQKAGIRVDYEVIPQNQALGMIRDMYDDKIPPYDLMMYDNHWVNYMVQNHYLAELTEFLDEKQIDLSNYVPELRRNYIVNRRTYGIPYTGGSQMLFYRQDLFENPVLAEAYRRMHNLPLRPPRTWTEFNHIAQFFTRRFNPASPTPYGATFAGATDETMSCEILPRLWALGGKLWDAYSRPTFQSNANQNAYQLLHETLQYTDDTRLKTSLDQTVLDFLGGKTAMLVAFSEYTPQIIRSEKHDFQRKIGYYHIPGRKTVSAGYCLGLNPFSEARREAFDFLEWISDQNTKYLFTIFSGSPQLTTVFHNYELQRLYPWLYYTEKSIQFSQDRTPPLLRNRLVIPPNQFEQLICMPLRRMVKEGLSAKDALEDTQKEAVRVFTMYGMPKRRGT
ncbi:MAG: extracellular solute-binding protein [Eubacterium sp.]|nr:extracellular solute-binding protein [Eubacterium sp.]